LIEKGKFGLFEVIEIIGGNTILPFKLKHSESLLHVLVFPYASIGSF